ncbi:hypothetical protein K488DRAFT_44475 [Vararia minispora EC-137]|uniref:Uncharacterized protein n=1 Tax=Vararia minispora EC-137 TaxID=1314806 RepID=A0ACB8QTB4_9AGAM|nr:hypothetical protein K488DRAFT_44475 [Vararia minispora EC-137]
MRKPTAGRQATTDSILALFSQPENCRIPKKFRWTGEVCIKTGRDSAKPLCKVDITEATEAASQVIRLNTFFNEEHHSIKLEKLLTIRELRTEFLPACQKPSQIARVVPAGSDDMEALESLRQYMTERELVSYTILELDGKLSAMLIIVPSRVCAKVFDAVPPHQMAGPMIALLAPFTIPPDALEKARVWRSGSALEQKQRIQKRVLDPKDRTTLSSVRRFHVPDILKKPKFHQALRILFFPLQLLDFMLRPNHPFAIWHHPSDGSIKKSPTEGYETEMLREVMKVCGQKELPLESADVRVLFVHVGSVGTLHMVPNLVERKQQYFLQINTYGTYHTVPPERWGIREIYPIGGVITLTPGVLKDRPLAVNRLIGMAHEHPLWVVCITPTVLASVLRETYGNTVQNELGRHVSPPGSDVGFVYAELLKKIDDGQLSLIREPPVGRSKSEDIARWIDWHWTSSFLEVQEIISECLDLYERDYASLPGHKRRMKLQAEVQGMMQAAMQQPVLMDQHRRYVVVTGSGEVKHNWTQGGVRGIRISPKHAHQETRIARMVAARSV